jgi:lipopolysaccharide export LptBFGC system permease protein LptF
VKRQENITNVLAQIETAASDEFAQLADIGAEMYATADLLVLKGKLEEALKTFNQLHKLLQWVGFSSPAWVLLAFPFGLMGANRFGYFLMGLFPIAFFAFIIGSYLLKRRYNSKGYLEYIGAIIDEELRRRARQKNPTNRGRR